MNIKKDKKQRKRMFRHLSRRLFLIAAAAVVFITTYALILPAITIDANTAAITPGFDLSSETKAETVVEQQSDGEAEVTDIPDLDGTITVLPDEDINQPSSNPDDELPEETTAEETASEEAASEEAASEEAASGEEEPADPSVEGQFSSEEQQLPTVFQDDFDDINDDFYNITVNVEALGDAFPEGTAMQLQPIGIDIPAVLDSAGFADAKVLGAVDISFTCDNIPPVRVTFTSDSFIGAAEPAVIHLKDGSFDIFSEDIILPPNQFIVETDSFSPFVIIDRSPSQPPIENPADPADPEIPADPEAPAEPVDENIPSDSEQPADPLVGSVPVDIPAEGNATDEPADPSVSGEAPELDSEAAEQLPDEEEIPTDPTLAEDQNADQNIDNIDNIEIDTETGLTDELGINAAEQSEFILPPPAMARSSPLLNNNRGNGGENPAPPATSKIVTNNNDGTYTIRLDIEGSVDTTITQPKANVIVVLDVSGSMDTNERWVQTGSWPWQGYWESRLDIAKEAINDVAYTLLNKNTSEPGQTDIVEMALISFSNLAETEITNTTSYNTFANAVNGLQANGGTNWEDALQEALELKNTYFNDGDPTFVIFVSDGNPTYRNSVGDGRQSRTARQLGIYGTGSESDANNVAQCYTYALQAAGHLVNGNGTSVGIGPDNFYTIGVFGNVDRMQGLTTGAGAPASNYFPADDADALAAALAQITEAIENSLGYSQVVINDGITSLTTAAVEGGAGNFRYYKTPTEEPEQITLTPWPTSATPPPPAAALNNNTVQWDLSPIGTLEDGVTYSVEFDVWPSQAAYDLIADLNNGIITYDPNNPQHQQIIPPGGTQTGYALKTNSSLSLSYKKGDISGQYNHDPGGGTMELTSSSISITKDWDNDIDELGGEFVVQLKKDTGVYLELTLNADNNYTVSKYIAPGIIVDPAPADPNNTDYEVKEDGHEYTLTESAPYSAFWELDADTYRPMVINTALRILKLVETEPVPPGSKIYIIDGKQYYNTGSAEAELLGYNHRKSTLNLKKVVNDTTADPNAIFKFTITLLNAPGGPSISFPVTLDDDPLPNIVNNTPYNVEMKAGQVLSILNLPSGTDYQIVESESEMPEGFELESIGLTINNQAPDPTDPGYPTISGYQITGKIVRPNRIYDVTYTNKLGTVPAVSFSKVNQSGVGLAGATLQILEGSSQLHQFTTTSEQTLFTFNNLKYGVIYCLKELKAPDGYIILNKDVYFKIDGTGIILCDAEGAPVAPGYYTNVTVTGDGNLTLQIENTPGAALPSTGGIGTRAFTLMGLTMMISSALVWAYHERRKNGRRNC
ncbi:MAG: SpaA isopeptide-forming pilin-related protein [Eubacteriales bacterium]|jgi:LPXTG-motif cell wall-anchored protein